MRGEQQIADFPSGKTLGQQIAQGEKVSERFAHLLSLNHQMRAMQPVFHEPSTLGLQACAFTLRYLVLVMRKNQVFASDMQIKARPQDFHAHRAALDVPAGPALAPRTWPENVAVLRQTRLPKREVGERFLRILIIAHPLA